MNIRNTWTPVTRQSLTALRTERLVLYGGPGSPGLWPRSRELCSSSSTCQQRVGVRGAAPTHHLHWHSRFRCAEGATAKKFNFLSKNTLITWWRHLYFYQETLDYKVCGTGTYGQNWKCWGNPAHTLRCLSVVTRTLRHSKVGKLKYSDSFLEMRTGLISTRFCYFEMGHCYWFGFWWCVFFWVGLIVCVGLGFF